MSTNEQPSDRETQEPNLMTNESKPSLFGPSAIFDLASWKPSAGKSILGWLAAKMSSPVNKETPARTYFGDCKDNSIQFSWKFDQKKRSRKMVMGKTRDGMSEAQPRRVRMEIHHAHPPGRAKRRAKGRRSRPPAGP